MESNQTLNLSGLLYSESNEDDKRDIFFNFVVNGVLLNLIGMFGLLGNVLSMVILSRQTTSSYHYLLICLARCDSLLILMTMLVYGAPAFVAYTGFVFVYFYFKIYPYIVCSVFPLSLTAQMAAVYLTVMVTLERFVAVCRPLHSRSLCTYHRTRQTICLMLLFASLFNLPRFWDIELEEVDGSDYDGTLYVFQASSLRVDPLYINLYINWMNFIFVFLLPFSVIAVLNLAIYRQVRIANRERRQLTEGQKKDIELATILLAIVIVFLLCNILPLVNNVTEIWYEYTSPEIVALSCVLVTINSSVNFIIYVFLGQRFRTEFYKMLLCKRCLLRTEPKRENADINTSMTTLTSSPGNRSLLSVILTPPRLSPRQRTQFHSTPMHHLTVQEAARSLHVSFM